MRRSIKKSDSDVVRVLIDALESRRLMATASATANEQLFIELLNSARANPT